MSVLVLPADRQGEAGFSLTEVLVSVFIFAVIGTISVGLMSTSLNAREQNSDVLVQTGQIDLMRTLLREDLGQVVLRPVRTREGRRETFIFAGDADGLAGPFAAGGDGERVLLSLTRRGRANPGLLRPRSSLARVDYVLREGELVRRVLPYPDGANPAEASQTVLAAGLADVELEFLIGAAWTRRIGYRSGAVESALPRAVRLRYVAPRLGDMEHVVLTSEAGG
ncbi:type II secretion system protein GspJ [Maricaulis sp.]|uniref:type II secretion system protein GspJ n=1 Tax=Maricaulis sp. TaxID=1486257 RepID=UPI0025C279D8|nr:type II secretion system protein GspJ [Maricaulis sp.]